MKVAIVKLSALGDIVHAMASLQYIKQWFPDIKIDWIVEETFKEVLEHNPHIDNVLTVNIKAIKKDKLTFFSQLQQLKKYRGYDYDLVIDLQGLIKSAIVSKILGKNVGFDKTSIREKAATFFYREDFCVPYSNNVIERNIRLLLLALGKDVEIDFTHKKPFLHFLPTDIEHLRPYMNQKVSNIVHVMGASWESKVYPKEKFVEIIQHLEGNHLLLWGNEKELVSAHYVSEHTQATVLPKMNLNGLKALVSQADLVIGADSGPTHFAWALNRPSITIFGPTPSQRNTMLTSINKVIDCGKKIDPLMLDKKNFCIRDIEANDIVCLAKGLLG